MKQIFAKCGRNFGKTELICYCLWRYAKSNPNSENYYFAPLAKQAKEIIWASRRVQTFGPSHWLLPGSSGVNNSELRLRFTNGSFIKLDGSDNVDSYRGIKPRGLSVYDEYKDFKPEFHDAMDPNYAAHDSPLIVLGTPPEVEDHHFYHLEDEFKINENKEAFAFSSFSNTFIDHKVLYDKKKELYRKGEGDSWEREYMVKKVFGGKNSIFPMLSKDQHVRPHAEIMRTIKNDRRKMEWATMADPGTTTCFGTLFAAMNPYNRKLYILDEIYEREQAETSVKKIGPRIIGKQTDLYDRADWYEGYDEAAAWFANEMQAHYGKNYFPTEKAKRKKEDGLSLLKDLLLSDMIVISDRCEFLVKEMLNYVKDKNGKIPKVNDHLIDCLRYLLDAFHYDMNEELEAQDIEEMNKEEKPFYSIDEDFEDAKLEWNDGIEMDGGEW